MYFFNKSEKKTAQVLSSGFISDSNIKYYMQQLISNVVYSSEKTKNYPYQQADGNLLRISCLNIEVIYIIQLPGYI